MKLSSIFKPRKWASLICETKLAQKMSDAQYLKLRFYGETGYKLNLQNPKTFNEKLQWLKIHNRREAYTMMVDKVAVKEYVAQKLEAEYVIPNLGVWERPEDVDFDALPDRFVIKCNHNSGLGMYICRDKANMDREKVLAQLRKGLAEDYYLNGREWPYKNVPRRILAEEYLSDGVSDALEDYKVLCFDGEPKLIELHRGRFTEGHTQDFYDTDWNKLPIGQVGETNSDIDFPRPELLEEMLELSARLAEGIPHVRVDWYEVKGKLYFGELTFFDGSGFCAFLDIKDDYLLGNWIPVP